MSLEWTSCLCLADYAWEFIDRTFLPRNSDESLAETSGGQSFRRKRQQRFAEFGVAGKSLFFVFGQRSKDDLLQFFGQPHAVLRDGRRFLRQNARQEFARICTLEEGFSGEKGVKRCPTE